MLLKRYKSTEVKGVINKTVFEWFEIQQRGYQKQHQ